jgi:hypothetical protein
MGTNGEPFNIEVTADGGGSKWIRDVVSHSADEIRKALDDGEVVTIKSADGGEADVDMNKVFMVRFQDGETFKKRSAEVKKHGDQKAG